MKNRLPEIVQDWLDKNPDMSMTKLAQKADINPSTLSLMLKKNPRRIDLDTVEKLRSVIHFELVDLIEEIGGDEKIQ